MNKDNIYLLVGKTLELIQMWEEEFKKVTIFFNIDKSDDKRSLSNMNSFLYRNKYISDDFHLLIKKIILGRNIVIHKYFLDDNIQNFDLESFVNDINKSIDMFKKIENE